MISPESKLVHLDLSYGTVQRVLRVLRLNQDHAKKMVKSDPMNVKTWSAADMELEGIKMQIANQTPSYKDICNV